MKSLLGKEKAQEYATSQLPCPQDGIAIFKNMKYCKKCKRYQTQVNSIDDKNYCYTCKTRIKQEKREI